MFNLYKAKGLFDTKFVKKHSLKVQPGTHLLIYRFVWNVYVLLMPIIIYYGDCS